MASTKESRAAARAYLKKKGKKQKVATTYSGSPLSGGTADSESKDTDKRRGRRFGGGFLSTAPNSLAAAETVCTGALVAYDLLGAEEKKLPRPGPIVASIGFYAMLGLTATASATFAPAVVAAGWVLALSVLVTGKRGKGVVKLLADLAGYAGKLGSGSTSGGGGAG